MKAWYRPKDGATIPVDFWGSHYETRIKQLSSMGLETVDDNAYQNGWVRLSNANENTCVAPGYVSAASLPLARQALVWMDNKGCLPNTMYVEIEKPGEQTVSYFLEPNALVRFIDTGAMRAKASRQRF